jgi:uncharacterized LabA/DUF88 family protein
MVRVAAYVDGFNLYFGLKESYGRKYLWLDLQALAESLLRQGQTLARVTYFTARVRGDAESQQRQSDYLDALASHCSKVSVVDGRFQQKRRQCRQCGTSWTVFEEKQTDVHIAVSLVEDGVRDLYDSALLISADSDLCPAVRAVKRLRSDKRIIAAFPPRRNSDDLKKTVDGYLSIGHAAIRQAQLPAQVMTSAGIALSRPKHWS